MRGDVLADAGEPRVTVYHKADGLVGQLAAQAVHEEISAECNVVFEGFLVQRQRVYDLTVTDLDDSFPRTFSVNQGVAAFEVDVGRFQRAQFGYSHSSGEQQLNDGNVPDATAELIVGLGCRLLRIHSVQKRLDRMERDCLWQEFCLPETDVKFCERIFSQQFPVFQMMEECFQARDLAPDGLGLVLSVQSGDKVVHDALSEAVLSAGAESRILIQVDPVGLQSFVVQTLAVRAVLDIFCDIPAQTFHLDCPSFFNKYGCHPADCLSERILIK